MDKPRRARIGRGLEVAHLPAGKIRGATSARKKPEMRDRQGVWVHSFMCNLCGVHFNVYSWLPDRHSVATITCPECGQREGKFRHFVVQTSEAAGEEQGYAATLNGQPGEIWKQCPPPGAGPMTDTNGRGMRVSPAGPSPHQAEDAG